MKSFIYEGHIRHRRFRPASNSFSYSLFMLYLDLDELPQLFKRSWFWSSSHFALAWFRRQDHLFKRDIGLKTEVKEIVTQQTGKTPQGPIRLLTHLRYFGYCFNPLSLYYCFDEQDQHIECIVAEVSNTPWGERHCYVLTENINNKNNHKLHYQNKKDFHVSPFMNLDMDYHWRLNTPNKKLLVHIENHQENSRLFDATLVMQRKAISASALNKALFKFPIMTLKVILLIHYQALKLWLKKVPYIPHQSLKKKQSNSKTVALK